MSGDCVDDEEPDGDRRRADEAGDDPLTQKIMRPFSHGLPSYGEVRKRCLIRRKYPSTDYIPSEHRRARTLVRAWHRSSHQIKSTPLLVPVPMIEDVLT